MVVRMRPMRSCLRRSDPTDVQSLLADPRASRNPRIDPGHQGHHRQPAVAARYLSRLPGTDRPKHAGWSRACHGEVGHADAADVPARERSRPRGDQHQEPQVAPLAPLAETREPMLGVPWTSFAEPERLAIGKSQNVWFSMAEDRPLFCFPGIYVNGWTSVRKVKEGATTNDLFAFLTTEPNTDISPYHPRAMPVIFRTTEECDLWMTAPLAEAMELQRPLPDGVLQIVARGGKTDGEPEAAIQAPVDRLL
jgi:hypothetical protein